MNTNNFGGAFEFRWASKTRPTLRLLRDKESGG